MTLEFSKASVRIWWTMERSTCSSAIRKTGMAIAAITTASGTDFADISVERRISESGRRLLSHSARRGGVSVRRFVLAFRIGGEIVAGERIGARTRAAAQVAVFAGAAFASELAGIAQGPEERRVTVDFDNGVAADVPGGNGQKPAWKDVAGMGNEQQPLAIVDAGRPRHAWRRARGEEGPFLFAPLGDIATIVLRLRGLNLEGRGFRQSVESLEYLLIAVRIQVGAGLSAPHRNEKEQAPKLRPAIRHPLSDLPEEVEVMFAHGGIDLRFEPDAAGFLERENGAVEGTQNLPKLIMDGGRRAVETDGHARDSGGFKFVDRLSGQQRRCAGRHGGAEADMHAVAKRLEQVGALEWVAAGKEHERVIELADVVEQHSGFGRGQLTRIALRAGAGAAMQASQVAGLRGFPDDDEGVAMEVAHDMRAGHAEVRRKANKLLPAQASTLR